MDACNDKISRYQYSHPEVQVLIKSETEQFDLVMVEINTVPMIAFAKKFNAPLVAIVSYDAVSDLRQLVGSPTHPVVYPDPLSTIHQTSTLQQRLLCVVLRIAVEFFKTYYIYPAIQELHDQYFDKNYPPVEVIVNDISLVLANSDPVLHGVKPLVPTIIQFGGGIHRTAPKPLPSELKYLLDEAINGFIYFSLGSNVKSKDLAKSTQEKILQAFKELPYTILWKFEEDLRNKTSNVITRKWLPQQDVLKHPNIKLFITQGGLQSIEEAVYDHVPMLGMPFYADQIYNVHKMKSMGYGSSIYYKKMSKEEFKTAILEVIDNPKYKNRIKELAELASDQPMTGLEKAIWWTEYVIRHNGTKHLRSPVLDIPFYQYYFLDVIAIFATAIAVLISIAVMSLTMCFGSCARILGIATTPSYSHQVVFQPIWKELSLRGHHVVTITTDPIKDPTLTNLTEIDLSSSYDLWNKNILRLTSVTTLEFFYLWTKTMVEISHYQYSHPEVQRLINSDKERFDLVMVEMNTVPMIVFAHKFNAPLITMLSFDALSNHRRSMGSPIHPIAYPDPLSTVTIHRSSTLSERLYCIALSIGLDLISTYYITPMLQELHDQYFDKNYPPVEALFNDVSLLLTNSDPVLHGVKPLVPTIIQFGGGTHRNQAKPLPSNLKKVLDEAKNGFIYFSLGSNAKSKDLSDSTREKMLQAFKELPYTVLWKYEANIPNKPSNVITQKWFPQQDILKHPNIKLFITQGGLQSIEEAIYDHVPMLGMPVFADQMHNVHKMRAMGYGSWIDYDKMSKDEFKMAIAEIIENPKYKNRIKELAELVLDQPMTGLEKAIWWTEYVIRHNGTKHLRSPMLDIPFYQYYLLDVIAVFATAIVVLISIVILSCKLLFKLATKFIPSRKTKVN
ncbi:hypothetical protein FQR65_LT00891 [Abscondita terminalis]|nr:hypothetical protein FQR65_LT00891 [Abscondita terminalis]